MTEILFDPGAQNERTRLAWQRTLLSTTLCSLVVARLVAMRSPVAGVLIAACAVALALVLTVLTRRRYASAQRALHGTRPLPDGRVPLTMVLLILVLGMGAGLLLLGWP